MQLVHCDVAALVQVRLELQLVTAVQLVQVRLVVPLQPPAAYWPATQAVHVAHVLPVE